MNRLKIGQEVLIHGYIDEIRKDVVIIRNEGGYFGTIEEEITDIEACNVKSCPYQDSSKMYDEGIKRGEWSMSNTIEEIRSMALKVKHKVIYMDSLIDYIDKVLEGMDKNGDCE